jgi:hypothetical protein
MRRVAAALILVLVYAACRQEPSAPPEASPSPTSSPTASPTPKELPGASCEERMSGEPENTPDYIEGEAFVQIIFQAFGVDLSGEEPVEIYKGPKEFTPGFPTVLEVEELGDFEATISWGIGLSTRACFVVDATPTRITLEFPSDG